MSRTSAHVNLCIVQPSGYVHSLGLLDAALYFKYQFERLGARVEVSKNRLVKRAVNFVFGAHLGFDDAAYRDHSVLVVNLEQLGDRGARLSSAYLDLLRQLPVIDYDASHAATYGVDAGDVPVVSFGYAPYLTQAPATAADLARRPIDLLFFGSVNARREAWFRRIEATGRRVSVLKSAVYGPERDAIVAQAKAVLNVHHYDSTRFEQVRAFQVLSIGTPLISERTAATAAPQAFDLCTLWFDDANCESFFGEEFLSPLYFDVGARALEVFREADGLEEYAVALEFALGVEQARRQTFFPESRPAARLNLDVSSPHRYRPGWLNVGADPAHRPDLVLDTSRPLDLPVRAESPFAGDCLLEAGAVREIDLGVVHPGAPTARGLMDNCLALLGRGGTVRALMPLEAAPAGASALQDAVRQAWRPFTDGSAGAGWFEHRFDVTHVAPVADGGLTIAAELRLEKIETGLAERTLARAASAGFGSGYALLDGHWAPSVQPSPAPQPPAVVAPAAQPTTAPVPCALAPTTPAPVCSIIVPVFNKVEFTQTCVETLSKSAPAGLYELIVIDNASTDGTADYLAGLGDRAHVISNRENAGFVGACNQGAAAARGRYLVFLNNDTVPLAGWLQALVRMLDEDATVGAAGARLVYPDGRLQEAGGLIFSDGSGWNFGRLGDPTDPAYSRACEVDYCSGAALMVRRELFERLGGFDVRYAPAYYEDTDLCFGVRSLGYKVMYCPEATVVHFEGVTAGTDLNSGFKRYQQINHAKFVQKWAHELARQDAPPQGIGQRPTTQDRRRLSVPARPAPVSSAPQDARPHILIVDPMLPIYDRASGSLRLFRIVQMYVAMGWKVTFVARNGENQEAYRRTLEDLGVTVYASDPERLAKMGYDVKAPRVDLERILRQHPCSIAWLSFFYIAEQYLPEIRAVSPHTRIVVDTVDVHFLREARQAELAGDAAAAQEALRTRERELAIYGRADLVVTVTDADAEVLHEAGLAVPTATVPNIHLAEEATAGHRDRDGLLFVGNFNHPPNADAVRWLVRDILPRVRNRLPGIRLTVVGQNPPPEVRALAGPGVTITGWIPDVAPYLEAARISVAPLRVGAGMKGKIGEALAHGLPVVTTPIGAEGMGLVDGQDALIAQTADAFAEAIVRLQGDDSLWERLSAAGRAVIEAECGLAAVASRMLGIVQHLQAAPASQDVGLAAEAA